MADSKTVDEVIALFKANGGRATSTRRTILQTLVDHGSDHTSAEQLLAIVQQSHPDVAPSTVYRFLDDLESMGLVDHVHLRQGTAVYHFTERTHDHLVCDACNAVIEVPSDTFRALRQKALKDFGFVVPPRHFSLAGLCRDCAGAATA